MDRGGVLTYGKRRSMCVLSILKFACACEQAPFHLLVSEKVDSDKIVQCESTRPSGHLVPK